jgi:hypothetical protein
VPRPPLYRSVGAAGTDVHDAVILAGTDLLPLERSKHVVLGASRDGIRVAAAKR